MIAPWITYRPAIKVLDCTIRDGGLVNNHQFSDDFVRGVYQMCVDAGVDYMEIGYKGSEKCFDHSKYGAWKFCKEEDVRRIVGENNTPLKLSAMIDAGGKTDWTTDVLPKSESVFDVMRVAFYVHQLPEALEMIQDASDKGYETWSNIMAVSTVSEIELDQALNALAQSPVATICVVDSYGSMYAEQIEYLVKKYLQFSCDSGKEVGIHAHNNQQLAFANSIEAIIHGANRIDASLGGLGRGAGNCPMELILGFLRNPKFKLRAVYHALQYVLLPLKKTVEWGPYPEYNLTGQFNLHPRDAIEAREGELCDRYGEFYDKIVTRE
ncbi:MAG: aldolase catalytic domain-containing protein [Planctomycetaceae bacterium]|nr:aldolase catalytic domain-containing protein [Planctomycetaceae bacterium]